MNTSGPPLAALKCGSRPPAEQRFEVPAPSPIQPPGSRTATESQAWSCEGGDEQPRRAVRSAHRRARWPPLSRRAKPRAARRPGPGMRLPGHQLRSIGAARKSCRHSSALASAAPAGRSRPSWRRGSRITAGQASSADAHGRPPAGGCSAEPACARPRIGHRRGGGGRPSGSWRRRTGRAARRAAPRARAPGECGRRAQPKRRGELHRSSERGTARSCRPVYLGRGRLDHQTLGLARRPRPGLGPCRRISPGPRGRAARSRRPLTASNWLGGVRYPAVRDGREPDGSHAKSRPGTATPPGAGPGMARQPQRPARGPSDQEVPSSVDG
jgi:hypothetical protein